jgi:class 3 adenylate cyclase/tetratricopeptide (TPR) repeat protein
MLGEGRSMPVDTSSTNLSSHVPRVLLRRLMTAPDQLVHTVDGTVVFADISGFTRLSERLARHGREGAEQLVDTINWCFSELLADAYANGGSLLKFGGDALLLWFDGEEHSVRACTSAMAMRSTLRRIGRIRLGSGSVVLRMSVGVHSGSYETFLVGGSHREYVIAGPATSTAVAMEGLASAGQILLSADTARLLPRSCLGSACGPGVLLARSPSRHAGMGHDEPPRPPGDVVAACLSSALRAHLLAGPVAPEHRTATATFIQFGNLDDLIGERGAEAAARELDELVRVVQDAADRYEVCLLGSDVAANGGKLLLSAGAPRALGDDEERMLLALRQVVEAHPSLPVRIGVNRGHVFTGEVGPPYRRTYAVMGDAVNLAARLMAKAPWGTILTTAGVLQRSKTRFERIPVAPFLVKGKTRPVEAWEVGKHLGAAPPGSGPRAPLIGRDQELAVLRGVIDDASHGRGGLVEITGDTGAGASRLLAEARDLADGMRFVHTSCEAYTRGVPYIASRDLLRQVLGIAREDRDEVVVTRLRADLEASQPDLLPWLPLLAIAAGAEAAPTREVEELAADFRTDKLHEVVVRFLGAALNVPTLVQVEHAHAMDEASASLLETLASALASSSWTVIITRRDVDDGFVASDGWARRVELAPLSREDTLTIAESSPEALVLPPHVVALAVERSEGNPDFLMDLLAAAAGGSHVLPDSIEAAASTRIDALDPGDRALVRRAALLGLSFDPRRLRHVLGPETAPPGEDTWDRLSGIFARDPGGQVRFKRPALCEVAYDGLPFRLRRELHAEVARSLERDLGQDVDADPAVLSLHFSRAGDHDRAWKYAVMGAERATARFANSDAARLYRVAIEAGRAAGATSDELASVWESLGEALRQAGERAAAAHAYTSARRLIVGDPVAEARLFYREGQIAQRGKRMPAAVRWVQRGLRTLEDITGLEARTWRARLVAELAGLRMLQGRFEDAERLCHAALAEAKAIGELRAEAHACYTLDWARVESGRSTEAVYSQRALEIYEQLGDPERESAVLNNLGMFAYYRGCWDEAADLYRKQAACSERSGNPANAAYTDCNVGEILSDQGNFDEAKLHLERARRVWSATGEAQNLAFVMLLLGRLAIRTERYAEGLKLLADAEDDLRGFQLDGHVEFAANLLVEAEALGGDPARALKMAELLLRSADRYLPLLLRACGFAYERLGQRGDARREFEASIVAARDREADYDVAAGLDALKALGGLDPQRTSELDELLKRFDIVGMPGPSVELRSEAPDRRQLEPVAG